jgi:NAD+ kinase
MSMQRSEMQSEPASRRVERVAVVIHGRPERIGDAVRRLEAVAERCGVTLVDDAAPDPDLAVVLGGDGTTLRALQRYLGSQTACLGVNFGRVGFLTSVDGAQLEQGMERVFAGRYDVEELPTLSGMDGGETVTAINDVVLTSGTLGRMVILEWCVDGASLGEIGCDGAILATPTGSTAYNLSAGGPVLAWGTDAFVLSFASPHSLHARSMVLGRGHRVDVHNRSDDVSLQIVRDGRPMGQVLPGGRFSVRLGDERARLARLSGSSFFSRYRETFTT